MISKYSSFLLEKAINESTLYVSPTILKRLQGIDSEIARDLIAQLGQDIKPDATFLDESEKEGELTFITMKNAKKKLSEIYPNDENFIKNVEMPNTGDKRHYSKLVAKQLKDYEPQFWKQSRNPIKVGRLVNQIFPGKYTAPEVEAFVNMFKSSDAKETQRFILVDGEEIEKYYWHENYKEMSGDLGKSCMAKKKFFDIYVQNPEVCRLLVLLEGDLVIGRSLIWTLDSNDKNENIECFMDRQYTIEQSDVLKFTDYAKEKGWAYKTHNNHSSYSGVTYNGEHLNCEMSVKVKPKDYDEYPYMDTFKRYDWKTGMLFNDEDKDGNEGQYILEDTGGGYTEIEDGVWSDWHGRNIDSEDAIWSDPYDDYILSDYAVHVEGRGYYHIDDESIVYCEWDDSDRHQDDCRYSDYREGWINRERAVRAVCKIDREGKIEKDWFDNRDELSEIDTDMRWYQVLSSKNTDWTIRYPSGNTKKMDRMIEDLCDKWKTRESVWLDGTEYPRIFKRYVYRLEGISEKRTIRGSGNPRLPKEYMQEIIDSGLLLSINDCKMLGFEYTKESEATSEDLWCIDDFEYHKRLSDAGPDGDNLLSRMIDLLKNDLIPNTERIRGEGEEDMKKMYEDRLETIWGMMPEDYKG
jgi:hypothetical protein